MNGTSRGHIQRMHIARHTHCSRHMHNAYHICTDNETCTMHTYRASCQTCRARTKVRRRPSANIQLRAKVRRQSRAKARRQPRAKAWRQPRAKAWRQPSAKETCGDIPVCSRILCFKHGSSENKCKNESIAKQRTYLLNAFPRVPVGAGKNRTSAVA